MTVFESTVCTWSGRRAVMIEKLVLKQRGLIMQGNCFSKTELELGDKLRSSIKKADLDLLQ